MSVCLTTPMGFYSCHSFFPLFQYCYYSYRLSYYFLFFLSDFQYSLLLVQYSIILFISFSNTICYHTNQHRLCKKCLKKRPKKTPRNSSNATPQFTQHRCPQYSRYTHSICFHSIALCIFIYSIVHSTIVLDHSIVIVQTIAQQFYRSEIFIKNAFIMTKNVKVLKFTF